MDDMRGIGYVSTDTRADALGARCDRSYTTRRAGYDEPRILRMGNHLIDLTGPEFNKQPFTRSWIFGVYGGKVIFYEEMVSRAFLVSKPQACVPIKSPKAVAVSGFYPTVSCIRHSATTRETTVSMEAFAFRRASPPETAKAS
jgi:hypothetical protein